MSTASAARAAATPPSPAPDQGADGTSEPEVNVHSCTRLGRTANPPRFSIASWFRFGRRR